MELAAAMASEMRLGDLSSSAAGLRRPRTGADVGRMFLLWCLEAVGAQWGGK